MRLLHTMIRVANLDTSIDFYTCLLGMTLLRRKDYPAGRSRWPLSVTVMNQNPPQSN